MVSRERMRDDLAAAMSGADPGLRSADRLCAACVDLLHVDGAAISLVHDGASRGTFGASGPLSRRLDALQFTFGEGPCIEAVITAQPVLVKDLADPREQRWPGFAGAVVESGMRAVYALPVLSARSAVGALDLFRHSPSALDGDDLVGGLLAAELAELPILALQASIPDPPPDDGAEPGPDGWDQLSGLNRVEVHQATGMILAAMNISATEALLRLRAHAIAEGLTASECAWQIIDRRMSLNADGLGPRSDDDRGVER